MFKKKIKKGNLPIYFKNYIYSKTEKKHLLFVYCKFKKIQYTKYLIYDKKILI